MSFVCACTLVYEGWASIIGPKSSLICEGWVSIIGPKPTSDHRRLRGAERTVTGIPPLGEDHHRLSISCRPWEVVGFSCLEHVCMFVYMRAFVLGVCVHMCKLLCSCTSGSFCFFEVVVDVL